MDLKHRVAVVVSCASLLVVTGRYGGAIGQEAGFDTVGRSVTANCDPTITRATARGFCTSISMMR